MKKTILNFLCIATILTGVIVYSVYQVQKPLLENFYKYFHATFEIPGLKEGFVPQGITFVEKENIYLLSGYMHKEKSASRIYVLDHGEAKEIELYLDEETPYMGHCGGIASSNKTVWLANDKEENCIWTIELESLLDSSKLYLNKSFKTDVKASTCDVHDGYLWVGEYEDSINYFTDETHHLSKQNPSLILAYKINENSTYGVNTTPEKALSVRNRLQGIEFDKDHLIYLSSSCGIDNSNLDVHENVFLKDNDTTITLNDYTIPVWILNKDNLKYDIIMPPMSEEITFNENDLYIIFDSASKKYKFGKYLDFNYIYRY